MIGKIARAGILAFVITAPTASLGAAGSATAGSIYDGRWSLSIVTQQGSCETYNFPVQIANGAVTFPGLNKASGRVAAGGAVRVNVTTGDRTASGSGKLTEGAGSGHWTGRSGEARCSGTWTAQRS